LGYSTIENKAKFENALKMASCFDFVQELSEKYHVRNNGINVRRSKEGQKNSGFLLLELYKDIDIIILDEATSARLTRRPKK
jgi:ABC-type multidrug transport system fused ATPase/permease subunit